MALYQYDFFMPARGRERAGKERKYIFYSLLDEQTEGDECAMNIHDTRGRERQA